MAIVIAVLAKGTDVRCGGGNKAGGWGKYM